MRGGRRWPAAASSTTSTATACSTSSPRPPARRAGPPCTSTGGTAPSRTAPSRPAWADCGAGGDPDRYVSTLGQPNRLYRNDGDGTFTDVAPALGVAEPIQSFACWFWDYDNDGRLDLYVNPYGGKLSEVVRSHLG